MTVLKQWLVQLPGLRFVVKKVVAYQANREAINIAHHFDEFLRPVIPREQALREEVHKIRHDVYCQELEFEPVKADGKERDEFDDYSIFCMIEHKHSQHFAGCVRVVTPLNDSDLLPLEKYCQGAITDPQLRPDKFDRSEICEISRLAVPAEFRRRQADKFKGAAAGVINEHTYSEHELRCFPFIAIGLYLSAASIVINRNIQHCFVMMEPRLARSMRFVGIKFKKIGPTVDYHGRRAPYYINPREFLAALSPGFQVLFQHLERGVKQEVAKPGCLIKGDDEPI